MATQQSVLFWDDVERLPDQRRLGFVLDTCPDGEIVAGLRARAAPRELGRDGRNMRTRDRGSTVRTGAD